MLLQNINNYVKENDHLWHLGDWSLGGSDSIWNFRKQINCKNIHIILGNHDHHISNNRILDNCKYDGSLENNIIDGVPNDIFECVKATELFRSNHQIYSRKFLGNTFVLSHYAMRTWEGSWKNSIMLYGHSHNSLPFYQEYKKLDNNSNLYEKSGKVYRTMDVGVDSALEILGEMRPFSTEEILQIMKDKISFSIDRNNNE